MKYTLIATNTVDACIHIYPPPPSIHTVLQKHMHTTTHNIQCQGWGGWARGQTQAPHKHPLSVDLSAPPPLHFVVWVVGPLLVVLRVRERSIFSLQVCWFFDWGDDVGTQ